MTIFGKLLVFLNLILGIGAAVKATSVYASRPGYYTEVKEGGIDKGNTPISFTGIQSEIDAQGRLASLASVAWGTNLKALEEKEGVRATRYDQMFGAKGLIFYAQKGGAPGANGGGFFNLVEDSTTKLLDIAPDSKKAIVNGPDNQPLKGTDTLLERVIEDGKTVAEQAKLSYESRLELTRLGTEIGIVQTQVYKQREIRDNLLNEAVYLTNFEINATLNRDTYKARQKQLIERLVPFRAMDK